MNGGALALGAAALGALYLLAGKRPPVVAGGRLLSRYGPRADGMHWGVDVAARAGAAVRAAAGGTVAGTWPNGAMQGYGNTVVIDHGDGTAALYAHLAAIAPGIARGVRVAPGALVGFVGSTNSAGGFTDAPPHLHLEIFAQGRDRAALVRFHAGATPYPRRLDPAAWARARGVQLFAPETQRA